MSPGDFGEFEHSGWDSALVAESYHRNLSEMTTGCISELFRLAGLNPGQRILDVACGAGYVASAAHRLGATVIGLDFSAAQLLLARQANPGLPFVAGDAEALPFPDGAFDIVFNAFGFPHLPHPATAAAEAFRVLAPGGRIAYASWCEPEKCIAFAMVYTRSGRMAPSTLACLPGPIFSPAELWVTRPQCSVGKALQT